MCMPSVAIEKDGNGYDDLDSVVLRAMVDRGGCTCDILMENHIVKTGIFIEKFKNMSASAPENNVCGLAIDIEMLNDEYVSNPIECTNGVARRPFSIVKNDVLRFTSRIIQGNFTRGYCMHIIRGYIAVAFKHIVQTTCFNLADLYNLAHIKAKICKDKLSNNIPQRLKIVCNESEVFRHESSSINPTETKSESNELFKIDEKHLEKKEKKDLKYVCQSMYRERRKLHPGQPKNQTEFYKILDDIGFVTNKDDDTLFIAIGVCVGVLFMIVIAIIVMIITRSCRRRSNKRLEELQRNTVPDSNQENEDPQYDGLKYNVLYVTATQQQDTDINYSTVDLEGSHIAARHSEVDNHYNTVESNAETSSLQTLQTFHDNEAIINNKTSKSSNETKNLRPPNECSVVYDVVDKRLQNPVQNSSTKIQDDANPEQAYAFVDKTRNEDP
ncbi:unnamed protein product [Mytilus coruscus]|uniref:Uncharacterized protein n=1 Tax=Mytilus coruscus TaxID=42192 RepID=A0A6J8D9E9_MYTCO|nr:unnamed protein product [Mytilus coruscus]